jgi:plastocyanin
VRRHPLDRTARRRVGLIGLALFVASCVAGASNTPVASDAVEVTVGTASGDGTAFVPAEVTVDEGRPVTMTFRNGSTVPHNLVFTTGITAATRTIVEPGASEQLSLTLPAPGSYRFVCTIHAGMAGALVVVPA